MQSAGPKSISQDPLEMVARIKVACVGWGVRGGDISLPSGHPHENIVSSAKQEERSEVYSFAMNAFPNKHSILAFCILTDWICAVSLTF